MNQETREQINKTFADYYVCPVCLKRHRLWSDAEFCCLKIGVIFRGGAYGKGRNELGVNNRIKSK